jgi:shikimate kinase
MTLLSKKENIILTGFMGTGKTTVGRLLAGLLDYAFLDTDDLIEARYGRSILQIFAELGEAAFRQMEREIAQELSERECLVIATGGRLMLDPANIKTLGQNSHIFCLVATPTEILARLAQDNLRERPLLSVPDPGQRIVELLQERSHKYQQFTQVTTDGQKPIDVAHYLVTLLQAVQSDETRATKISHKNP